MIYYLYIITIGLKNGIHNLVFILVVKPKSISRHKTNYYELNFKKKEKILLNTPDRPHHENVVGTIIKFEERSDQMKVKYTKNKLIYSFYV